MELFPRAVSPPLFSRPFLFFSFLFVCVYVCVFTFWSASDRVYSEWLEADDEEGQREAEAMGGRQAKRLRLGGAAIATPTLLPSPSPRSRLFFVVPRDVKFKQGEKKKKKKKKEIKRKRKKRRRTA